MTWNMTETEMLNSPRINIRRIKVAHFNIALYIR